MFSLKSANNSSTLNSLNVNIASTTLVAADGTTKSPSVFSNVRLWHGSQSDGGVLTQTNGVTTVAFTNLTIPLSQDVWQDLVVKSDIAASSTGTGITVALTTTGNIVVTDANYNTATVESTTATSNAQTFTTNAMNVSGATATLGSAIVQSNSTVGYNVSYVFTLTNSSNNDLFVSATSSVLVATSTTGTAGSSTLSTIQTVSPSTYAGDTDGTAGNKTYDIPAGVSRTFTLVGAIRGTTGQTGVNLKVTSISYGISAAAPTSATITAGLENLVQTASF